MRGWGDNIRGEFRRKKKLLQAKIELLDAKSQDGWSSEVMEERRSIESDLEKIFEDEELYWQ